MQADKKDIGRDKVVQIINSVIEKVEAAEDVSREHIYQELRALHDLIEQTRREISATQTGEISGHHIATATDELDAVVAATEVATTTIMDSCDAIMDYAGKIGGQHQDALTNEATKILESCSFQDITGQRITKVVKSLKIIDTKIGELLAILEEKIPGLPSNYVHTDTRQGDEKLMNGPQAPDKAISQSDIDKLLADLF